MPCRSGTREVALALVFAMTVLGCAAGPGTRASATPPPDPTAVGVTASGGRIVDAAPSPPTATPTLEAGGRLAINGTGRVDCASSPPHGCLVYVVIRTSRPGGGDADWQPSRENDPRFAGNGSRDIAGEAVVNAPARLAPGRYRLAGVVVTVGDLPTTDASGNSVAPRSASVECVAEVDVPATALTVDVTVTFGSDRCTIGTDVR